MTMRYVHMITAHLHRAVTKLGTEPGTMGTVNGRRRSPDTAEAAD
jgi:hypothetical protein